MGQERTFREVPDPVVTLNRAGTQVLLGIRRERCAQCGYGVRVETLWASGTGEASEIAWCESCFNADTEPVELDDNERSACGVLVQRLLQRQPERTWTCARPAVADLEARGLA